MSGFRHKQVISRKWGGYYDEDGYWIDGALEELTITASIQPLNSSDKAVLADGGYQYHNAVKLYTDTPLRAYKQAIGDNTEAEGDTFVWQDTTWQVVACYAHQMKVISHFKCICVEVSTNEQGSDEDTA